MKKSFCRQWLILSLIPLFGMGACTKRIYIPVETFKVVRDSALRVVASVDTLMLRDSVSERVVGDTVVKEAWHTRYVARQRRDTVVRVLHDTVSVETPVVITETSSSSKSRGGIWTAMAVAALILLAALYLRRHRHSANV